MDYMQVAIDEAYDGINQHHGGPFGSVVVKNGEIVGKGHNKVIKENDPTAHGEIEAIRDACKNLGTFNLSDCELYTTAEPCPMCLGAILWSNISKVYYGCSRIDTNNINFRDDKFYKFFENNDKSIVKLIEHRRKQCLKLFSDFSSQEHELY